MRMMKNGRNWRICFQNAVKEWEMPTERKPAFRQCRHQKRDSCRSEGEASVSQWFNIDFSFPVPDPRQIYYTKRKMWEGADHTVMSYRYKNKKGFTLVELIVVLLLLAILLALLIPSLIGYITNAQKKACLVNKAGLLRALTANEIYELEGSGKYDTAYLKSLAEKSEYKCRICGCTARDIVGFRFFWRKTPVLITCPEEATVIGRSTLEWSRVRMIRRIIQRYIRYLRTCKINAPLPQGRLWKVLPAVMEQNYEITTIFFQQALCLLFFFRLFLFIFFIIFTHKLMFLPKKFSAAGKMLLFSIIWNTALLCSFCPAAIICISWKFSGIPSIIFSTDFTSKCFTNLNNAAVQSGFSAFSMNRNGWIFLSFFDLKTDKILRISA